MGGDWRESDLISVSAFLNRGAAPAYVDDGGILVVNQKCIRDHRVDYSSARRTDPARKPIGPERELRPWDILVNSTGIGTLGRVAQVTYLPERATVDSHVTIVRPDRNKIEPRFLGYVLRHNEAQIEALGEGSTGQTELSRARLGSLSLLIPSRSEQRAIAHILGTLDDKIEVNRRMSATLEAMARALFKSWFVDFEPVRAKAEGRDPGLPPHLAALFPDRLVEMEQGELPDGWCYQNLSAVFEVNPPRSLAQGLLASYLDMANMPTSGHFPSDVVKRPFVSGMKFRNGDTLVARITPCLENGKTAYVDFLDDGEIGWGSTEYIVLRPRAPWPDETAYLLARDERFREFAIQSMTGTSGRQRVPAAALNHFHL